MAFTAAWIILLSIVSACKGSQELDCEVDLRKNRELNINVNSEKNDSGDWTTTATFSGISSNFNVDASFRVSECQEKLIVHIRGVLTELMKEKEEERLLFHPNCGNNIAIINDGRYIVKLKDEEELYGVKLQTDRRRILKFLRLDLTERHRSLIKQWVSESQRRIQELRKP